MNYRHEIDGLRAIAVMGVILYHVGLVHIGAGYAGVDIFFVISGFLIGGIILRQRADGTFRYRDFYARRARRILPALFLVIFCAIVAGWFTMMPHQFRYFGGAAMSTLLFVSNIWFFEIIDYFNPAALKDPLLHTWSLSVEEQFYVFVPVLFGLLWRFGKKAVIAVFLTLAIVSLVTAISTNSNHPMAAFYLIHTRAWELFAGVLAALVFPALNLNDRLGGGLTNVGLLLIFGGLVLTPAHVPWPGYWTILPVAGTVLVLLFGQAPSLAGRVLMLRPVTSIGLISYSAYLWHQPVISFLEISGHRATSVPPTIAIILAILALSWLSWRYVEQPFRNPRSIPKRFSRAILITSGLGIGAFAVGAHITKGYPDRVSPQTREILASRDSYSARYKKCIAVRSSVADLEMNSRCIHGADAVPNVAIWGDSHAARLSQPLGDALGKHGISLRELTLSSCQPIPNMLNYRQKRAPVCTSFNTDVLDYLLATPTIETVILHAGWPNYIESGDETNWLGEARQEYSYSYPIGDGPKIADTARKHAIENELAIVIRNLTDNGKAVILLHNVPSPGFAAPDYYGRKVWYGELLPTDDKFPSSLFKDATIDTQSILISAAQQGGAVIVDASKSFCPNDECYVIQDRDLLYTDANHLSLSGVALITPLLLDAILSASKIP